MTRPMLDVSRLARAMADQELTQAGLAKLVGISPAAVQQLLNGKTKRSRYVRDIAKTLNVSEEWLYGEVDHRGGDTFNQLTANVEPVLLVRLKNLISDNQSELAEVRFLDRRLFPFDLSPKDSSFLLVTDLGSDMVPSLWPDDHIGVDEHTIVVTEQDKIWVVEIGEIPMIRRIRSLGGDMFDLIADNSQVSTMRLLGADFGILGCMVWHARARQ